MKEIRLARVSIFPSENERLHERHLVEYITPIFMMERLNTTFPSHYVLLGLVNCEECCWLPPQQQSPNSAKHILSQTNVFDHPHYFVKFLRQFTGAPLIKDGNYGLWVWAIGDP
jgi:hypothetical protein